MLEVQFLNEISEFEKKLFELVFVHVKLLELPPFMLFIPRLNIIGLLLLVFVRSDEDDEIN